MAAPKGGVVWFTGYRGQPTLVIDDVRMADIPTRYLLRMCDHWEHRVYVHGGTALADWVTVVILNNHDPASWYDNLDLPLAAALYRRMRVLRVSEADDLFNADLSAKSFDELYRASVEINI